MFERRNKEYSDLLKHPLWQKKRLEILQRDNFECCYCHSKGRTLHVHHLCYKSGCKPWEYDNGDLITLCDRCHNKVHEGRDEPRKNVMYSWFMRNDKFTANEKIVLSFLIDYGHNAPKSNTQIAKLTNVSRYTIIRIKKKYKNLSIFKGISKGGYFYLHNKYGLSGELLIFYSWLKLIEKNFVGKRITYDRNTIALHYGKSMEYIRDYLQRLRKLGLIERGKNLELIIK